MVLRNRHAGWLMHIIKCVCIKSRYWAGVEKVSDSRYARLRIAQKGGAKGARTLNVVFADIISLCGCA